MLINNLIKMKNLILAIVFSFISIINYGQNCCSFSEAMASGILMTELDSTYTNAITADTTVYAVFAGQDDEFYDAYIKMLQELGGYLKKNSFLWEQPTNCFHKIYFSEEGKIDYWLYSFKRRSFGKENEARFKALLNEFQNEFTFSLPAKERFSQCGSVRFQD